MSSAIQYGTLGKTLSYALPAAGAALGGPLGAMAGLAMAGAVGGNSGIGGTPAPAAMPQFVQPGTMGQPSLAQIGTAMQANPALAPMLNNIPGGPLNLGKLVTGIDPPGGTSPTSVQMANTPAQSPTPGQLPNTDWSGVGDFGSMYMKFLLDNQLIKQQQKTAWAPAHSSTVTPMTGLNLVPPQFQIVPPNY
jgi:hypothetical protein